MASRHPKLWKVTSGCHTGLPVAAHRPESRRKAYEIYVANDRASGRYDWSKVWIDERDGRGWQLYEAIEHTREPATIRAAVVEQMRRALLDGLEQIERHGNGGACVGAGDVEQLIARVTLEVGRG